MNNFAYSLGYAVKKAGYHPSGSVMSDGSPIMLPDNPGDYFTKEYLKQGIPYGVEGALGGGSLFLLASLLHPKSDHLRAALWGALLGGTGGTLLPGARDYLQDAADETAGHNMLERGLYHGTRAIDRRLR